MQQFKLLPTDASNILKSRNIPSKSLGYMATKLTISKDKVAEAYTIREFYGQQEVRELSDLRVELFNISHNRQGYSVWMIEDMQGYTSLRDIIDQKNMELHYKVDLLNDICILLRSLHHFNQAHTGLKAYTIYVEHKKGERYPNIRFAQIGLRGLLDHSQSEFIRKKSDIQSLGLVFVYFVFGKSYHLAEEALYFLKQQYLTSYYERGIKDLLIWMLYGTNTYINILINYIDKLKNEHPFPKELNEGSLKSDIIGIDSDYNYTEHSNKIIIFRGKKPRKASENTNLENLNTSKTKIIVESLFEYYVGSNKIISKTNNESISINDDLSLSRQHRSYNNYTHNNGKLKKMYTYFKYHMKDTEMKAILRDQGIGWLEISFLHGILQKYPERKLVELYLRYNHLGNYGELTKHRWEFLTTLILNNNKINTLDGWQPSNVSKLKRLALSYNNLQYLPDNIEYLGVLTQLSLYKNQFKNVPYCLFNMFNLSRLWIKYNYITNYPEFKNKNGRTIIYRYKFYN